MRTRPSERKGDWRAEFWVMSMVWLTGMRTVDVINWQTHVWKAFVFLFFNLRLKIVNRGNPRVINFVVHIS